MVDAAEEENNGDKPQEHTGKSREQLVTVRLRGQSESFEKKPDSVGEMIHKVTRWSLWKEFYIYIYI